MTKTELKQFTSWLGKRSYKARLERLGLERLQEIARENGKQGGRPKGSGKRRKGARGHDLQASRLLAYRRDDKRRTPPSVRVAAARTVLEMSLRSIEPSAGQAPPETEQKERQRLILGQIVEMTLKKKQTYGIPVPAELDSLTTSMPPTGSR